LVRIVGLSCSHYIPTGLVNISHSPIGEEHLPDQGVLPGLTKADIQPAGHALQLAQARLVEADAEVALEEAQKDLADLELRYNQNLAQEHKAKAFAELLLDEAQKNLLYFWPRHAQQLAQARQSEEAFIAAFGN